MERFKIIRYIYLYLVTAISIVLIIISTIGLINLVLKEYVFDVKDYSEIYGREECSEDLLLYEYDKNGQRIAKYGDLSTEEKEVKIEECKLEQAEKTQLEADNNLKRDLVWYISMLIVALPLYFYHWGIIKKENKKN